MVPDGLILSDPTTGWLSETGPITDTPQSQTLSHTNLPLHWHLVHAREQHTRRCLRTTPIQSEEGLTARSVYDNNVSKVVEALTETATRNAAQR